MSDDESFRQTPIDPIPLDTPEPKNAKLFSFERKDSFEIHEKVNSIDKVDSFPEKKMFSEKIMKNDSIFDSIAHKERVVPIEIEKSSITDVMEDNNRRKSLTAKRVSSEIKDNIVIEKEHVRQAEINDLKLHRTSSFDRTVSFEGKEDVILEIGNNNNPKKVDFEVINPRRTSLSAKRMSIEEREEAFVENVSSRQSEDEDIKHRRTSMIAKKVSVEERENIGLEEPSQQNLNEIASKINGVLSEEPSNEPTKRRESFSKVEVTNITQSRKLSTGFIANEINKAEVFEDIQSIQNGLGDHINGTVHFGEQDQPSKMLKLDLERASARNCDSTEIKASPKTITPDPLQMSKGYNDVDTGDSRTDELIRKIKKQRSILEEILEKKDERNDEGT